MEKMVKTEVFYPGLDITGDAAKEQDYKEKIKQKEVELDIKKIVVGGT